MCMYEDIYIYSYLKQFTYIIIHILGMGKEWVLDSLQRPCQDWTTGYVQKDLETAHAFGENWTGIERAWTRAENGLSSPNEQNELKHTMIIRPLDSADSVNSTKV